MSSSTRSNFPQWHNGLPARFFPTSLQANQFTRQLDAEGASYRTKVLKIKREPLQTVVMLLEEGLPSERT